MFGTHPLSEVLAEISRRAEKAVGNAHASETRTMYQAIDTATGELIPFDEIAKLPISDVEKESIVVRFKEAFFRDPQQATYKICNDIKNAGGTIDTKKLEVSLAQTLKKQFLESPGQKQRQSIIAKSYKKNAELFKSLGIDLERAIHLADRPEQLELEFEKALPKTSALKKQLAESPAATAKTKAVLSLGKRSHLVDIETFDLDKNLKNIARAERMEARRQFLKMGRTVPPAELEHIDAMAAMAKSLFPLEEIKQLPIGMIEKNKILRNLVANPKGALGGRLIEAYTEIAAEGGTISPEKMKKLEIFLVHHFTSQIPAAGQATAGVIRDAEHMATSQCERRAQMIGMDKERVTKLLTDIEFRKAEISATFPEFERVTKLALEAAAKVEDLGMDINLHRLDRNAQRLNNIDIETFDLGKQVKNAARLQRFEAKLEAHSAGRTLLPVEKEAINARFALMEAMFPLTELHLLPVKITAELGQIVPPKARANEILHNLVTGPRTTQALLDAYAEIVKAGGIIPPEKLQKLEVMLADDLHPGSPINSLSGEAAAALLARCEDLCRKTGMNPDHVKTMLMDDGYRNVERALFPEYERMTELAAQARQEVDALRTANAIKNAGNIVPFGPGHTSGGGYSSPSTTVSEGRSEGARKIYQWFTHDEKGGFNGERAAISAGVAAALAGGAYLLKRRSEDNWQNSVADPGDQSTSANR